MLNPSEQKAVAKAIELGGARLVERVQYGVYRVPSATSDATYVVTVHGTQYVCDCTAGIHGKPCWHKAAVLIAKVEHASRARVRVKAPAAAPTPSVLPGERFARQATKRVALI